MFICAVRRDFGGRQGFLTTLVCAPTLGGGVPAKCDLVALLCGGRNGRDPSHPAAGNKQFDSSVPPPLGTQATSNSETLHWVE